MPREKELFRDNLERLDAAFPNKEMLTQKEVSKFTGISTFLYLQFYVVGFCSDF